MAQGALSEPKRRQQRLLGLAGLVLAILIALAVLGGLPPAEEAPAFAAGVVVLLFGVGVFGLVTWHLLLRPLPANLKKSGTGSTTVTERRLLALMAAIGGINVVVGGFWDEVWHRKYGLPFGEDLFWRPHLLIYSSFLITIVLAGAGLVVVLRRSRGTLQQRFRSNTMVGMLVIAGAFLAFVTPADPLWHIIYGEDISAWSIPHILLLASASVSMLLVAGLQLSTLPSRPWQLIWHASGSELIHRAIILIALALMSQLGLQVLTTEWEAGSPIVLDRPQWLLPALLVGYAAFVGMLGNHSTRLVGTATTVGVLALGIRLGLIGLFDYSEVRAYSWLGLLPMLIALDLSYVLSMKSTHRPPRRWVALGVGSAGALILLIPLINRLYTYPNLAIGDIFPTVIASMLVAGAAGLIGQTCGDYLYGSSTQIEETVGMSRSARLLPLLALIGTISFILLFVASASPPV